MANNFLGYRNLYRVKSPKFRLLGLRAVQPPVNGEKEAKAQRIHKALSGNNEWLFIRKGVSMHNDVICLDSEVVSDYFSFFRSPGDTAISMGAIVGRNGAGKSSYVELIIRVINNLSAALLGERFEFSKAEHLHYIDNVFADLMALVDNEIAVISIRDRKLYIKWYRESGNSYIYHKTTDILSNTGRDNNEESPLKKKQMARSILENLFYTTVFNYSLYGFNYLDFTDEETPAERLHKIGIKTANGIGSEDASWLKGLFHKNDGYQTPVVLNPMRNNGQIDIRKENRLAKERMLNLLFFKDAEGKYPLRIINDSLEVCGMRIRRRDSVCSFKDIPEWLGLNKSQNAYINFKHIYNAVYLFWDMQHKLNSLQGRLYWREAIDYLIYKTIKVILSYKAFKDIRKLMVAEVFKIEDFIDSLEKVSKDNSHITKKIRQTLNYLTAPAFNPMAAEIGLEGFQSADFLPPPIFETDLILKKIKGQGEGDTISFSGLSSGERQVAYIIDNILYHLVNIDSEWNLELGLETRKDVVRYSYVSVILDEIELYFHPELQRRFVYLLLRGIQTVGFRNLKAIDILFVTHSPFILSDIPSRSVLALDEIDSKGRDRKQKVATFGANILDMLSDTFFMDSAIGETVRNDIESLIRIYNVLIGGTDVTSLPEAEREWTEKMKRLEYVALNVQDPFWRKVCTRMLNELKERYV